MHHPKSGESETGVLKDTKKTLIVIFSPLTEVSAPQLFFMLLMEKKGEGYFSTIVAEKNR